MSARTAQLTTPDLVHNALQTPALEDRSSRVSSFLLVALGCGVLGVAPHLYFSYEIGQLAFFKNAFDEEFYFKTALEGIYLRQRLLGVASVRLCYCLTGHNQHAALILLNFIAPFMCALAAGWLSSSLTRNLKGRVLLVLGVLFGGELLSLGCYSIWGEWGQHTLEFFRQWLPAGHKLIPDYTTSYFGIFRSPEPQVSLSIYCVFLTVIVRCFGRQSSAPHAWDWRLLCACNILLPTVYFFFAVPMICLESLLAFWFLLRGDRRHCFQLIAVTMAAVLLMLLVGSALSLHAANASTFIFNSRLPIITPCVIFSTVLLCYLLADARGEIKRDPDCLLAAGCLVVPLALMNQQVITGYMISTRDWERYSCYPLLVLAIALTYRRFRHSCRASLDAAHVRWRSIALGAATVFLVAAIIFGQVQTYRQFHDSNIRVAALNRALALPEVVNSGADQLLLEDVQLAPLLLMWMSPARRVLLNFNEQFTHQIGDMPPGGGVPDNRSRFQPLVFEYFARMGISATGARDLLRGEAAVTAGFYSRFLFSARDFWYPCSDSRAMRQPEVLDGVERVSDEYEAYLNSVPEAWKGGAIFLSWQEPGKLEQNPHFRNVLLGSEPCPGQPSRRVYAYRQTFHQSALKKATPMCADDTGTLKPVEGHVVEPFPLQRWSVADPGVKLLADPAGMHVTTLSSRFGYAVAYPPLRVEEDGVYCFRLSLRVESGGMSFGALSSDRQKWLMSQIAPALVRNSDTVCRFRLELRAGDVVNLMLSNNHPDGNLPSKFTVKRLECFEGSCPR